MQREVACRLSAGEAAGALALLEQRGRLWGYQDAREARAALVACWRKESLHRPERALTRLTTAGRWPP